MHLRILIGSRAGEILDFCPESARAMLADGRAELPSDDIYVPGMPEAGKTAASGATAALVPQLNAVFESAEAADPGKTAGEQPNRARNRGRGRR